GARRRLVLAPGARWERPTTIVHPTRIPARPMAPGARLCPWPRVSNPLAPGPLERRSIPMPWSSSLAVDLRERRFHPRGRDQDRGRTREQRPSPGAGDGTTHDRPSRERNSSMDVIRIHRRAAWLLVAALLTPAAISAAP